MEETTTSSTKEISPKNLEVILSVIRSFPESEKLKPEELEKIAYKAIAQGQTQSEEWLKHQLTDFHNIEKEEHKREEVKLIEPSKPVEISNQTDLDEAINLHKRWVEGLMLRVTLSEGKRANLSGSNLAGMNLKRVNLSSATLIGTSFIGAKLEEVNFSAANLSEANFQGASIKNCQFKRCKLNQTDFRDSEITDCSFTEQQKEEAEGLFLHI